MTTYTSGAILTVRRPDGQTEDVVNTQHASQWCDPGCRVRPDGGCYKKAGRGDIISQRPNVVSVPLDVQRMALAGRLQDLADAFPGSSQWAAARKIESDLGF